MLKKIRIKLVLAHIDRVLEVLGGIIMVLTFTSVLSVSHAGKADVRAMLIASVLSPGELEPVLRRLRALPEPSCGFVSLARNLKSVHPGGGYEGETVSQHPFLQNEGEVWQDGEPK